jgi:hypothetical protein
MSMNGHSLPLWSIGCTHLASFIFWPELRDGNLGEITLDDEEPRINVRLGGRPAQVMVVGDI